MNLGEIPLSKDLINYTDFVLYLDGHKARQVQNVNPNSQINTTFFDEQGSDLRSAVDQQHNFLLQVDFTDNGSIDHLLQCVGQGYYTDGNVNENRIITSHDLEDASVDIILKVINTYGIPQQTFWYGFMSLTGISFSYSVDGIATESYEYSGEIQRDFLNDFADVDIYKADYNTNSNLIVSGQNLQDSIAIALLVNNLIVAQYRDGDTITLSNSGSDTLVSVPGETFNPTDRARILISGSKNPIPRFESTPSGISAIRGKNVNIYLFRPSENQNKFLRIKSVSANFPLGRQVVQELGDDVIYTKTLIKPLNIQIDLDLEETDAEYLAILSGNKTGFDAGTLKEQDIRDLLDDSRLEIVIQNNNSQILKRIRFDNLVLSSKGRSISVGSTGQLSLSFSTDNFLVSGSGISPYV